MEAKFHEKVSRAKPKIEKIGGQPKEDMLDLAQIKRNLQFIGLLRGEEPPSLDAEVKYLTEPKGVVDGAYEEFSRLVADLKEDLQVSPVLSNLLIELNNGEPIEIAAASVGGWDFSGLNRRNPGMSELRSKKTSEDPTSSRST